MSMSLLVAGSLSAVAGQANAPPPTPPSETRKAERTVRLDVSFILNGSSAGEVPVETALNGVAAVDMDQLLARLSTIVTPSLLETLRARAGGRKLVPITELHSPDFPLLFDLGALQLRVDVPTDARLSSDISVMNIAERFRLNATDPSDFSFGVSASFIQRVESRRSFDEFRRDPFNIVTQGFVNIGGKDGAYLTFLAGFREGGKAFRRRTTLFHDDTDNAVRYSVGDIDPLNSGAFSTPVSMFGIGVERLYQTIQPYRNLRPAGRGGLAIERPSNVEIYVNGAIYRTLSLGPGRYNLRDFPFLDGLNDVRLVVRDDTGRNETIGLSFFSDTELLEPGISIFSATLGFQQRQFDLFGSTGYQGSPTFSGLYQVGLSDRVTIGGSVQADRRNALISGQAVFGTKLGLFGFEFATDRNDREPLQFAALISYRLVHDGFSGQPNRLDIDFQYQSARFSPMQEADLYRNRYRYDINGRYQFSFDRRLYATVGGGFGKARGSYADLITGTAGLTRAFGRFSVSANYLYRDESRIKEHRGTVSVNIPLAPRQNARASYDTRDNRVALDYNLQGYEGLGQTSAQISLARDDRGQAANVEVEHFANRFRAAVRHNYDRQDGQTRQRTEFAITTGIGFADGVWAIGRDPDRGFVIVQPHRTLRDTPVIVKDRSTLGATARSDALGPALVPLQRAYQPNTLEVEVPKLRSGYDIGSGRLDVLPGAGSGYRWLIGSDASNTVVARLRNAQGTPLAYFVGSLEPIDGAEAKPVPVFTNATGRMVAQRLAPGRYRLVSASAGVEVARIIVPPDASDVIDLGVLSIKE